MPVWILRMRAFPLTQHHELRAKFFPQRFRKQVSLMLCDVPLPLSPVRLHWDHRCFLRIRPDTDIDRLPTLVAVAVVGSARTRHHNHPMITIRGKDFLNHHVDVPQRISQPDNEITLLTVLKPLVSGGSGGDMLPGSILGLVRLSPAPWAAVTVRLEVIRRYGTPCDEACVSPFALPDVESRMRFSFGMDAGEVPGLILTGAGRVALLVLARMVP